ncbi:MAG: ABC transporter permease [Pseudomonadota bacterium]
MSLTVAHRAPVSWRFIYTLVYGFFLFMPILLIPLFSVHDSLYISFPYKGVTWDWYRALPDDPALLGALMTSLRIAGITALLATVIATGTARHLAVRTRKSQRILNGIYMSPLLVPEIFIGMGLTMVFAPIGLSSWTVILGHLVITLPFAVTIMYARFVSLDPQLEEASFDLGVGYLATYWRVLLPLIAPSALACFLITFTLSFDEFIVSFFLASNEPTLPVYIYSQLRFPQKLPYVLALSSLILVGTLMILAFVQWLSYRSVTAKDGKHMSKTQ